MGLTVFQQQAAQQFRKTAQIRCCKLASTDLRGRHFRLRNGMKRELFISGMGFLVYNSSYQVLSAIMPSPRRLVITISSVSRVFMSLGVLEQHSLCFDTQSLYHTLHSVQSIRAIVILPDCTTSSTITVLPIRIITPYNTKNL